MDRKGIYLKADGGRTPPPLRQSPAAPEGGVAVSWTSFFTDTASRRSTPIMPLYLTRTLGGTAMAIGVIEGAAEALNSALKICRPALGPVERAQAVRHRGLQHFDAGPADVALATSWLHVLGEADRSRWEGDSFRAARCLARVVGRPSTRGYVFGLHRSMIMRAPSWGRCWRASFSGSSQSSTERCSR